MYGAKYILKGCLIRSILSKTPYELVKRKRPNISYFKAFSCSVLFITMARKTVGNLTDELIEPSLLDTLNKARLAEFTKK